MTTPKLKPEVKAKWLEALRSGRYQQGRSYLHTASPDGEDRFCCLGVLCDLAANDGIVRTSVGHDDAIAYIGQPLDVETAIPPGSVVHWAYQKLPEPGDRWKILTQELGTTYLPELNDDDRLTFSEIADLIEEYM